MSQNFTKENKRFFFNIGDGEINSTKGIIKYLGRYLVRSLLPNTRLLTLLITKSPSFLTIWLMIKRKLTLTMPSERFISHILIHLPPKNFKIVNRYGFYSRHISDRLKKTIDAFRKNIAISRYSFYQRQMYKTFGMNLFYCPVCKLKIIVWEFYHYRYPAPRKYY